MRQARGRCQVTRILSGIKPTGYTHLGNYLGALRPWVADQHRHDSFHPVVDLHALTVAHDPAELRSLTLHHACMLLAAGLDPEVCTVFVQSQIHEHTELGWLMECTVSVGELRRMTQFKDKAKGQDSVSAGLLTYPALMAADILLYDADRVPVGDDQRQHLELTRDLAVRFNHRYGETFTIPEAAIPAVGARIMDLQDPTSKMGKSHDSPQGTVYVLDEPADVERKIKRAVTDAESDVVYDPERRRGVANLLDILASATGRSPQDLAGDYSRYGQLKADTAAAVIEMLTPVRQRYKELQADPGAVSAVLDKGAAKAQAIAAATLERARDAVGLVSRRQPL